MTANAGHPPPFGFNVIGNVSSSTGLGVLARSFIDLLLQKGLPVQVLDLDPGLGRGKRESLFERYYVDRPAQLSNCINLFVLQPSAIFSLAASYPELFVETEKLNVGLIMWELPTVPRRWSDALKVLDVLAVSSDFIRSTFASTREETRMVSAPCPMIISRSVKPSRERFGLVGGDATVFLTSLDPNSDISRKNPFAIIEAFRRAFAGSRTVQLVIKLNNAIVNGAAHPNVVDLRRRCESEPNIRIIEQTIPYADLMDLYATCDVFVSLHRAEGLGLALMEAMALGRPVIATGWSGNMTFMDHANSCLVGYDLVRVAGTIPDYKKQFVGAEALWANPRIDDAAAWMKHLADDPAARKSIGERAAHDMKRYWDLANEARFVDELQAIWRERAFLPTWAHQRAIPVVRLWDAANTREGSFRRLTKRLVRATDQHLLWRFRSR